MMMDTLKEVIVNYVDVDPETITADSKFIEDLGFNSFDFVSMLGELEETLGVQFDEDKAADIHTVGEAAEYLQSLKG